MTIAAAIPDQGLARDANGKLIRNTGFAEVPIQLRDHDTGGAVANAQYVRFNIVGVSRITLWVQFTLGNLTNVNIKVNFWHSFGGAFSFRPDFPMYSVGSRVVSSGELPGYLLALSANIIIPVINPGAPWMSIIIQETHAVDTDDSKLGLHYSRSYLNHDIGTGIPSV